MKGIILAGGNGTRLHPITCSISKQLLPVYDKPMIYYPLSTLMLAGIKDIMIITRPEDKQSFIETLGDGKRLGISIKYEVQEQPEGLPQAFQIAKDFIKDDDVTLILGDNLIYGNGLKGIIRQAMIDNTGATIFTTRVKTPERFGVIEFDRNTDKIISIEEKPREPKSNYAITGLYIFNNDVVNRVSNLKKSSRNEYEMVDLHKTYLSQDNLKAKEFYRGTTWLDTGTFSSLLEASQFVKAIQNNKDQYVACIEEVAYEMGFISLEQLEDISNDLPENEYKHYIRNFIKEKRL